MGRDVSGRVYPESGVNTGFHPASHHGEREERIEEFAKINRYHVGTIPYFLERLRDTSEGESNLLEKTLILYGSPMGNPHVHNHKRCPLFLAGHGNGHFKGNPCWEPAPPVFLSLLPMTLVGTGRRES